MNSGNSVKVVLNVDQANKLNRMLPKGYRFISTEQYRKRLAQSKKKSKIVYVPVKQAIDKGPRRKQKANYYEGEEPFEHKSETKQVHFDYEEKSHKSQKQKFYPQERPPTPMKVPSTPSFTPAIQQPPPPPIEPINQNRDPYTPKQIIAKIKAHPKFYVLIQFRDDFSQSNFDIVMSKCEGVFYNLNQLQADLHAIFLKIYESYKRSETIYTDAAYLESYINNLIGAEKARLKESQKEEDKILEDRSLPLNRKKTIPPKLNEIKNITIMDKRILGQNIKKLAAEHLPEIVRIVFDTIETREQYEINIDTLPLKKLKQLQNYVSSCKDYEYDEQFKNDDDSSESSFVIQDDFD